VDLNLRSSCRPLLAGGRWGQQFCLTHTRARVRLLEIRAPCCPPWSDSPSHRCNEVSRAHGGAFKHPRPAAPLPLATLMYLNRGWAQRSCSSAGLAGASLKPILAVLGPWLGPTAALSPSMSLCGNGFHQLRHRITSPVKPAWRATLPGHGPALCNRGVPACRSWRGAGEGCRQENRRLRAAVQAQPPVSGALVSRCRIGLKTGFFRKNLPKNADFGDPAMEKYSGRWTGSNAPSVPRCAVRDHGGGRDCAGGGILPNRRSKHHHCKHRLRRVGGLPFVDGFPLPKGAGLIRWASEKICRWHVLAVRRCTLEQVRTAYVRLSVPRSPKTRPAPGSGRVSSSSAVGAANPGGLGVLALPWPAPSSASPHPAHATPMAPAAASGPASHGCR
jgi:hypothetical protein